MQMMAQDEQREGRRRWNTQIAVNTAIQILGKKTTEPDNFDHLTEVQYKGLIQQAKQVVEGVMGLGKPEKGKG